METTLTSIYTEHVAEDNSKWFVLRDLSRPNAKLTGYKLLEMENVTCFTPMHIVIKKKNGKNSCVKEPIIRSLVIAYASKEHLDTIISAHPTLQYRYLYGHSIKDPMVVSKKDMDRFIYAVELSNSEPIYYSPSEITPDKFGKEVRIIGGNLDGYIGHLLKMRGTKVKRLLIELKGLFVAGVEVDAEYIQFI